MPGAARSCSHAGVDPGEKERCFIFLDVFWRLCTSRSSVCKPSTRICVTKLRNGLFAKFCMKYKGGSSLLRAC